MYRYSCNVIRKNICQKFPKDEISFRTFSSSKCIHAMFNVQDEEDFQERVLCSEEPVLVDFHAKWCGPCKLLGPRLENVVGSKKYNVHLAKVNIDNISELALKYGVAAVPSVIAIKNGEVIDKFVGVQEEVNIEAFINRILEKK